jgi:serine/threonine-protein kinase
VDDTATPASAYEATSAADPSAPIRSSGLRAGTRVGEYVIDSKIGQGGMGTVYAAHHPVIGKKVAIKLLLPGLGEDPRVVERFVLEARAVNQIGHRNIIDIFAFGQLPSGEPYFVMELLPGRSLAQILKTRRLTFGDAASMMTQVLSALTAAHRVGIVHRDLKPDNILLLEDSVPPRVKLLDFGVAKLLRHDADESSNTGTGAFIGTPLYMSPEQCRGSKVDHRADLYSVGIILYELFTGRVPFAAQTALDTMLAHVSQEPPRPGLFAELPPGLEELVLACLQKDPEARPESAEIVDERLMEIAAKVSPGRAPVRRNAARIDTLRLNDSGAGRLSRRLLIIPAAAALAGAVTFLVLRERSAPVEAAAAPAKMAEPAARPAPEPPAPAPAPARAEGALFVSTNAPAATWKIDSEQITDSQGSLDVATIAPGDHEVTVDARGFQPRAEHVQIKPGEALRLQWVLAPAKHAHKPANAQLLDSPRRNFR